MGGIEDPREAAERAVGIVGALGASQMVYVVTKLGIADAIGDGAKTPKEIASELGLDAGALHRLLRAVAGLGVVVEEGGRFALTAMGAALRKNAPGPARATILWLGSMWSTYGELPYSMKTGRPAFEKVHGKPFFEHLANDAEAGAVFNETMIGMHGDEPDAIVAAYDFSGARNIVDVGGGTGNLLATVLRANPHARGTLLDVPQVADSARARLAALGLGERCDFVGGDFFEKVPSGGDVYLLSHVVHDWDETNGRRVLAACRAAMHEKARLLVVEMILPPGNDRHPAKMIDIGMLLLFPGARERTEEEYRAFFASEALVLRRVVHTASAASVMEVTR